MKDFDSIVVFWKKRKKETWLIYPYWYKTIKLEFWLNEIKMESEKTVRINIWNEIKNWN